MAKNAPGAPRGSGTSVKAPLIFSAVLAVVAGVAVFVFSTGGATRVPRWDLGLIAAGIAFVVCLVVAAMLSMVDKPNDEHLGQGSGINRRSSDIKPGQTPGTAPRRAEPGHSAPDGATSDEQATGPSSPGRPSSGRPAYGQRRDEPGTTGAGRGEDNQGTAGRA